MTCVDAVEGTAFAAVKKARKKPQLCAKASALYERWCNEIDQEVKTVLRSLTSDLGAFGSVPSNASVERMIKLLQWVELVW